MANVKFIRTTHQNFSETNIPIDDGSYVVVLDTKEIYLDKNEVRNPISIGKTDVYTMIDSYEFKPNQSYSSGDIVFYGSHWYKRKTSGSSSTFVTSDWDLLSTSESTASFPNNIDVGSGNFNLALASLVIGSSNFIVSAGDQYDILAGYKNFIGSPGSSNNMLIGQSNGLYMTSSGGGNSSNLLFGNSNIIKDSSGSSCNLLFGSNNSIKNQYVGRCAIIGDSNTIDPISSTNYVVAEGYNNNIGYLYGGHIEGTSHSVGSTGSSSHLCPHVEGSSNTLSGSSNNSIHIEGLSNTFSGSGNTSAHIEGTGNTFSGSGNSFVHIEGEDNSLTNGGNKGHIEGAENTLTGGGSNSFHIEGYSHEVGGGGCVGLHVEGSGHEIGGSGASGMHIEGYQHTMTGNGGNALHLEGQGHNINISAGFSQGVHIEGSNNILNTSIAPGVHVEGQSNTGASLSPGCHIEGVSNNIFGGYASLCGGGGNTVGTYDSSTQSFTAGPGYVAIFGRNNIANENFETVIGEYNQPHLDQSSGTLLLIGNGTAVARSNIVEVSHDDVTINGSINYYGNDLIAPLNKMISWFSPDYSIEVIQLDICYPGTTEHINAINPTIVNNLSELNTYFSNNNIDWIGTGTSSKKIHFYNPSTNFYFSFYRTEDNIGDTSILDQFAFIKLYSGNSIDCKTSEEVGTLSATATDSSDENNPLTGLSFNYSSRYWNGMTFSTGTDGQYVFSWTPPMDTQFFYNVSSNLENGEWWFWTTPITGNPAAPDWVPETLNLDDIMNYGYAKALQTQYNINWQPSSVNETITYKVNSIVIYNNCIYRCIVENSDDTWDSTHWEQIGITKAAYDALEARVAALENA